MSYEIGLFISYYLFLVFTSVHHQQVTNHLYN